MFRRSLKDPPPEEQPFPVRGYVTINLLFCVFLLLVYWAAYFLLGRDVAGMIPVLAGLAILFAFVSLYDAVFDRVIYSRHLRDKNRGGKAGEDGRTDTHGGGTQSGTQGGAPAVETSAGGRREGG